MPHISKTKFEQRGGHGCSDSHYTFSVAFCCGRIGVEDEELHSFYFNQSDLSQKLDLWEDQLACPFCGSPLFDLASLGENETAPLEWAWALV